MKTAYIHPIHVDDLQHDPNLMVLLNEYAAESSIGEMPPFNPNWDLYRHLEKAQCLYAMGAFLDDELVGFSSMLITQNPHYSVNIATVESLFVRDQYRASGLGLKLIYDMRRVAKERGAAVLFASAPGHSQLARVFQAMGWENSNQVFVRGLN